MVKQYGTIGKSAQLLRFGTRFGASGWLPQQSQFNPSRGAVEIVQLGQVNRAGLPIFWLAVPGTQLGAATLTDPNCLIRLGEGRFSPPRLIIFDTL